jgi:glutamate/tyrosine decarboxylase-like PLP-dependent enzyme
MAPRYRELLQALRREFPQPVSDPVHDAYFVYSISRALDQVDALKTQAPILGQPTQCDWQSAREAWLNEDGKALESVIPELVDYLKGMFIWSHPRCQMNVTPSPTIASIVGMLLPATYNPNLCSEESSRKIAEAEVRAASMVARLVGYDPGHCGGLFTFGGSGAMLYGLKIGLEKAAPATLRHGLRDPAVVLASDSSHYSTITVSGWLGIGEENLIRVRSHLDQSIELDALEHAAREALTAGKKIAAFIATLGTTDAFGLDDLEGIVALRDRLVEEFALDYRPHVHADAVIGWAWSVFNDYDFLANPLGFRGRTVRALAAAHHRVRHLRLADSIGIDFHKTGYTPYVSTLVLVKDRRDFERIARERSQMPYLYQTGEHHPGMYTLETTRSGLPPMAALANLLLLGRQGLQTLLGHAVEMAEVLRELIEAHPNVTVLNGDNAGPVTLFRVYPDGIDTFTIKERERTDPGCRSLVQRHNQYNRRIFEKVHAEALTGRGVAISLTEAYRLTDYGEPITALKSYVLSPFTDEDRMESIMRHVLQARREVDHELAQGGVEPDGNARPGIVATSAKSQPPVTS